MTSKNTHSGAGAPEADRDAPAAGSDDEHPVLWGKEVDDERYAVVATV
jgi:hypothetical protein